MSEGVVNIKGKNYKLVAARVEEFNHKYPDWSIDTVLIFHDAERVVMQAMIRDENSHQIRTVIQTNYESGMRTLSQLREQRGRIADGPHHAR